MKRKLKTLAQILIEFPNWEKHASGNIYSAGWSASIPNEILHLFGSEVEVSADKFTEGRYLSDHEKIGHVAFDRRWFEPLPKKKLLAYCDDWGRVYWWMENSKVVPGDTYVRMPEWDKELE